MTVHHIGYLVKDPDKAAERFAALGYAPVGEQVYDEARDMDIRLMRREGLTVELGNPRSDRSVAAGLLKTYKNAPYHICYETGDFARELARLEQSGFLRIDEPSPAPALGNRRVCFLYSAAIGMIELLEGQ